MSRSSLVSAVVTYNAKVWAAGLIVAVLVPLSLVALAIDLILRPAEPLSSRVLAASARWEATIDVHGALTDVRVVEA